MHYVNIKHTNKDLFFCKEAQAKCKWTFSLLVNCGLPWRHLTLKRQADKSEQGQRMTQKALRTDREITNLVLKGWRWIVISVSCFCWSCILGLLLDWEEDVNMFCLIALPRIHQGRALNTWSWLPQRWKLSPCCWRHCALQTQGIETPELDLTWRPPLLRPASWYQKAPCGFAKEGSSQQSCPELTPMNATVTAVALQS